MVKEEAEKLYYADRFEEFVTVMERIQKQLPPNAPTDREYMVSRWLGFGYRELGDLAASEKHWTEAQASLKELIKESQLNPRLRMQLYAEELTTLTALEEIYEEQGRLGLAAATLRKARGVLDAASGQVINLQKATVQEIQLDRKLWYMLWLSLIHI